MTVQNDYLPIREAGDGIEKSFDFQFKIISETDLLVKLADSVTGVLSDALVLNVDYTVAINTITEGGTVTYTTAPPSGQDSFIQRAVALTQNVDIPTNGVFKETQMENALDRIVLMIQQLQEELNRTAQSAPTDTDDLEFPPALSNRFIGWNLAGDALENKTLSDAGTLVKASTAEAEAGTDDAKYMTPSTVVDSIANQFVDRKASAAEALVGTDDAKYMSPSNVRASLGYFDVRTYGALGDDSNDDTTAIQAAIDAAEVAGGIVFLPAGTYKITSSLTIEEMGVQLVGVGRGKSDSGAWVDPINTTIKYYNTTGVAIKINSNVAGDVWAAVSYVPYVKLSNFILMAGSPVNTDTTVGIKKVTRQSRFQEITIAGFQYAMQSYESIVDVYEQVDFGCVLAAGYNNEYGLLLSSYHHGSHFNNCNFNWNASIGLKIVDCGVIYISGGDFEGTGVTSGVSWAGAGANSRDIDISSVVGGGNLSRVSINQVYFEATYNHDYMIEVGSSGAFSPFLYLDQCFFNNDKVSTDIYVTRGYVYHLNVVHTGTATDIGKGANGYYYLQGVTTGVCPKDRVHAFRGIGVGGTGIYDGDYKASFDAEIGFTIAANQTDYLEVEIGGGGNFSFLLILGGYSAVADSGMAIYAVSGYLNANVLSGGVVSAALVANGNMGTDVTIGAVTAKGSDDKIRISLVNGHATRDYLTTVSFIALSSNAAVSNWTTAISLT